MYAGLSHPMAAGVVAHVSDENASFRLSSSSEELPVKSDHSTSVHYFENLGVDAWSGCVNECLRSHFLGEMLADILMLGAQNFFRICCTPSHWGVALVWYAEATVRGGTPFLATGFEPRSRVTLVTP